MIPVLPKQAEECANEFFDYLKENGFEGKDFIARATDFSRIKLDEPFEFYLIGEPEIGYCFWEKGTPRRMVFVPQKQLDKIETTLRLKNERVQKLILFNIYLSDTDEVKVLYLPFMTAHKMMDHEEFYEVENQNAKVRITKSASRERRFIENNIQIIPNPLNEEDRKKAIQRAFSIPFTLDELIKQGRQFWEPLI